MARSCATASCCLFLFGLAKFTEAEALTIQPWVANSPFLGWLYAVSNVQGGSKLIGVIELAIGVFELAEDRDTLVVLKWECHGVFLGKRPDLPVAPTIRHANVHVMVVVWMPTGTAHCAWPPRCWHASTIASMACGPLMPPRASIVSRRGCARGGPRNVL